jgi:hypothetical protein
MYSLSFLTPPLSLYSNAFLGQHVFFGQGLLVGVVSSLCFKGVMVKWGLAGVVASTSDDDPIDEQ